MSTSPVCSCRCRFNDGHFISREYLGYGGHFSGDVKPGWFGWAKDDFLFSFVAGEGIGNYIERRVDQHYGDGDQFHRRDRVRDTRAGLHGRDGGVERPLQARSLRYSANGGYQHWWTPNLRSTIAAGIAHQDVNSQLIGPSQSSTFTKEQWNAFVNLVWNPVAFITTGVQYMYGTRVVVANGKGHEQVLIAKWRVAF